jgi:pimeloyl-ACP methyl ester carboxylesterase
MKVNWASQLVSRPPTDTSPSATVIAEQALQVMLARQARCATLSDGIYVDTWTSPDVEAGRFFDGGLNLRARAEIHDGNAFIAFRGTVGAFALSINWRHVNLRSGWTETDPPVHAGFWRAWLALKPQVLKWLQAHRPTSIYFTGHSMGAALAELAAFDLHEAWPVTRVILFATPMVGGPPFNTKYGSTLENRTTRYLLLTDAISLPLPRLLGYAPPDGVVRIDRNGVKASGRPGVLLQAGSMLIDEGPQLVQRGISPPFGPVKPLGPIEEHIMSTARLLALSSGTFSGWLAIAALALVTVLRRAVGYHSMAGYAAAMQLGRVMSAGKGTTWAYRSAISSIAVSTDDSADASK